MLGSTEIFGSGKRPLTDVKEEPLERDEDFEMIDSFRQEEDPEYQGEQAIVMRRVRLNCRALSQEFILTLAQNPPFLHACRTTSGVLMTRR